MKYQKLPILALILLSFLLSLGSCSFKNRQALLKTPYDADTIKTVRVINSSSTAVGYYNTIKPEDELAIRNVQDMNLIVRSSEGSNNQTQQVYTTFKVNANGEVVLPKIGAIKVAGLNRTEAANLLQKAYEVKELNAPLIDVRIANAIELMLAQAIATSLKMLEIVRDDADISARYVVGGRFYHLF